MASAKRGRVEQRKGWLRPEDLPPGRKTIDWWSAFDYDTELTPWTIGRPVAGDNPDLQQQKIFCVNGIAQGAGDGKRVGRSLTIKSIRFTGKMKPPLNPDDVTAMAPDFARISIIYDRSPKWTVPPPDGYSLGQQSMIDSMRRWCEAWQMVNRAGTLCTLPWGYGASQSTKEEYLIIANEVYELPATYKKLDFGRTLTSTVEEVVSATRGTATAILTGSDCPEKVMMNGTNGTFMTHVIGLPDGKSIAGTSTPGTVSTDIGTITATGFASSVSLQTTPGTDTPSEGTWYVDAHADPIGTRPAPPDDEWLLPANGNMITIPYMWLQPERVAESDPVAWKPLVETTAPAHVITTSATPSGDPPYGPTTNLQRTMPIPLCSPTGILFDVYRSVDLVVEYDSLAAIDSYGAQQITYGAIYVGIFTDVNVGWSWEGYVRMTYEDN